MPQLLSWTVGDVRVTRVEELVVPLPPVGLLPDATPEALAPHRSWLEPGFLDGDGNLLLSIHGLVVESEGRRMLVDTCLGDRVVPGYEALAAPGSRFLDELDAAGFPRQTLDTVVCTHLHFDHVGWNTMQVDGAWVPTFPEARYVITRDEYDHWKRNTDSGVTPTFGETVQPVVDAGLVDLVDGDHRLTSEVWLEPTPGHTPGHVAVRIASRGEQALITGDLTHHPVQWAHPDWTMHADSDTKGATETRRRLLAEHADQRTLIIGTHYAPPCAGHLCTHGTGARFDAVQPEIA